MYSVVFVGTLLMIKTFKATDNISKDIKTYTTLVHTHLSP